MFNKKGFTILELMITFFVVALLASMSLTSYRLWQREVQTLNAVDELKSSLRLAQSKAVAAAGGTNWGIHLATSTYVVFPGSFYDMDNPANQTKNIIGARIINLNTAISDGAGGHGPDVVFTKFTGETPNVGAIELSPQFEDAPIKTIMVTADGQVN
ncbi:MAG: prepilin-type N-terminal cleavage/methylation domain-containing protein [Patescibacteria group bacterium]